MTGKSKPDLAFLPGRKSGRARARFVCAALAALALSACATSGDISYRELLGEPDEPIASIDTLFGNYLAAHEATRVHDSQAAATYYARALDDDPGNSLLKERAFLFEVSAGNEDRATELATELITDRPRHILAGLTLAIRDINNNQSIKARLQLQEMAGGVYSGLVIDLLRAWTYAAEKDFKAAEKVMSEIEALGSSEIFRAYHLALMQDVHGTEERAEAFYIKAAEISGNGTIRITDGYGRLLERMGKKAEAVALYQSFLTSHPDHPLIAQSLTRVTNDGKAPAKLISRTRDGAAEALHGVAGLMARGQDVSLPILYLQLALWANPDLVESRLLLGDLYWQREQFEKSARALAEIPISHPFAPSAAVQIAMSLERMKRQRDAERVLRKTIARHPDDITATVALGDILRANEKYERAVSAYDRAFEIVGDDKASWFLYYSRGASLELAGFWTEAERDLLAALQRAPDQPLILNHLGYSWVDRGINLDRGLELIETAVELSPGSGLIVDSLGWAHYRLGDYDRAVKYLERALELVPEDPTLHEHLGDAYWMSGRRREARFQWQHALDREPTDPNQIKSIEKKLVQGMKNPAPTTTS